MNKKLTEMQQSKKDYPPELIEFFKQLHDGALRNIEDMNAQIADAEQELAHRRSLGEDI